MESGVHAAVPLRVGKKMRKRRELDALVVGLRGGRLLSASSDEGEPWGRRTTRRRRSRPFVRLAAALALCVCVVSAATVLWLFVDVRRQIVSLRIEMDRVSTRSDSVGDALQICHAAAKSLRTNVSDLNDRLTNLEKYHSELSSRVDNATKGLQSVTSQLEATPNIVDMPKRLNELQRTVADFGSQIKSFESSFNLTKRQASTAIAGVDELKTLLNQLEIKTNETAANVTANIKRDEDLKTHIDSLNSTLETKMTALLARMEENNKSTSAAAPTAAVSTPSSTTLTASNGTTQAPTLPPAPPAKPNVLQ